MLYYALLTSSLNEIGPVNEIEMIFTIILLLISSVVNALIFSEISLLITTISQRDQVSQQQLDDANTVMD